jgi:hypothetical protein
MSVACGINLFQDFTAHFEDMQILRRNRQFPAGSTDI